MLILPIVNKNRILNVEVKFKEAEKIRTGVKFDDALESEIIVNGKKLSDSSYKDSKDDNVVVDFIRNNSLLYRRNYLITTREEADSSLYDVYEVSQPPKKVNEYLDNLYASVVTDMRKEIPGVKKGRYLSLAKLGFDKYLTDEKIARLQEIVKEVRDTREWPRLFEEAGIADLPQTLEFINSFDCTVVNDTTIPEDELQGILKSLEVLNTRDSKSLRKYYNMALSNRDIYAKISYINKIIYDKPLSLIQSKSQKQKQLVKVNSVESEFKKLSKFSRFEKLIGKDMLTLIKNKTVLVLGCGGVGGYVIEALARSGVGKLILVDFDIISESNINRQIIALDSTVGRSKIDVLAERVFDINKECQVIKIDKFIDSGNLNELFSYHLDYFVDACDTIATKKAVISECLKLDISFISCMGTGNKMDPAQLEIVDIRKTLNDPVARILRKFVKDMKINKKIMVLTSREVPKKIGDRTPASTAFVPSSAGLLIASYIIREFINEAGFND